ncbi:MAG TPA: class I SAM-dependent methyltransferase [Stellaceae bacterium]|nr:class I SAM-dependent methyltransferase [Stellaceae bacterium]
MSGAAARGKVAAAFEGRADLILRSNLPRLRQCALAADRVLDIGGWYQPFNLATHVLDLCPYTTRRRVEALDPEDQERFNADTWHVADVCAPPWPYPDKHFDFVVCSNLLEDVRDPLAVCRELNRVGRAGYIETPSRLREIYSKRRLFPLRALRGNVPEVGFYHHRWFVEAEGSHLKFTAKTTALLEDRRHYLTRGDVGRPLSEAESGLGLFWQGGFTFEEAFVDLRADYAAFRRETLAHLRSP